jgi:hypothetical protein
VGGAWVPAVLFGLITARLEDAWPGVLLRCCRIVLWRFGGSIIPADYRLLQPGGVRNIRAAAPISWLAQHAYPLCHPKVLSKQLLGGVGRTFPSPTFKLRAISGPVLLLSLQKSAERAALGPHCKFDQLSTCNRVTHLPVDAGDAAVVVEAIVGTVVLQQHECVHSLYPSLIETNRWKHIGYQTFQITIKMLLFRCYRIAGGFRWNFREINKQMLPGLSKIRTKKKGVKHSLNSYFTVCGGN